MLDIIFKITDWLWAYPMLIVMVGGGLYLSIQLKFMQFVKLPMILKRTIGKSFNQKGKDGKISGYQAVTAALASTLGTGNIVGVAFAIAYGGPGAVFWMWVVGLVACAIKFSEIIIAIKYRHINEAGDYVGGPMYYLSRGTPFKWLGSVYAVSAVVVLAIASAVQAGSVVDSVQFIHINRYVSTITVAMIVVIVVYGGIRRIVSITEKMVPVMSLVYVIGGLTVIAINYQAIPGVIESIFVHAFTTTSAAGGFIGSTLALTIRWGVARGIYSNDSGNGLTSITHSNATIKHPVQQGMWGVFEVLFSTMFVCSITAFAVLTSGIWTKLPSNEASSMTIQAYQGALGTTIGGGIVSFSLFLFALSTIIAFFYFGEKQMERLFGLRAAKITKFIYCGFVILGGIHGVDNLIKILDFFNAIFILVNMFGIFWMTKQIKALKEEYFADPEYYDKPEVPTYKPYEPETHK